MKRTNLILCRAFFGLELMLGGAFLGATIQGCVTATAPAGPVAPGFSNSTDQQMGSTLAAADQFYNRLQADQVTGAFKPTSAEVTALNTLQQALAVANPIYLAYHNGTGTLAAAQQAISNVSTAQTNAQTLIGGK
jgi:hypothetical protein